MEQKGCIGNKWVNIISQLALVRLDLLTLLFCSTIWKKVIMADGSDRQTHDGPDGGPHKCR